MMWTMLIILIMWSVLLMYKYLDTVDVFTFSLMMFKERIQMLLNFCSPAAVPTEWKVQLIMIKV